MSKIGKIIGAIVLLLVVIIGGLSLLVHYVLTENKLKAILVPRAEQALGRQVAIGAIKVGLFSGIVVNNFTVKEADGKSDFISARAFVLRYDLLPLLEKRLAISELLLDQPTIRVHRKADGNFNYQSLAIFSEKKPQQAKTPSKPQTGAEAMPLALSIDRIKVQHASFSLDDERKELPTVNAFADLALSLHIGRDLKSLSYDGTLDLDGTAAYGEAKPHFSGKTSFDQSKAKLTMEITTDGQTVNLDGNVADYRESPKIKLDLTSKELNIDRLLALVASPAAAPSPSAPEKRKAGVKQPATPIAASLPKGLEASGKIAVAKAVLKGVTVNALLMRYQLANGILKIPELGAVALGGSLASSETVDLTKPDLSYTGNIDLSSVQAKQLCSVFAKKAADVVSGSLQSSVKFAGSGTAWDRIKQGLTADGDFAVSNGQVRETPITTTIAALLGTDKLRNITFNDLSGHFRIVKGGKVELKSSLHSADVQAETAGQVGLDGSLDLPLTVTLSPAISSTLSNRAGLGQLFQDSAGNTVLHLKLAGTVGNPSPTLDSKGMQKQIGTAIQKKLLESLTKPETPSEGTGTGSTQQNGNQTKPQDTVNKLFKGIFGK